METSGAAMLVGMLAGESPVRGTYPVATVVISGDGAGDLDVKRQEVLPWRTESRDGGCATDALMGTMPVVVVRPVFEGGGSLL